MRFYARRIYKNGVWYYTSCVEDEQYGDNMESDKIIPIVSEHPDVFGDILEFHKAMCPDQINERPCFPPSKIHNLRFSLCQEEYVEFIEALANENLVEMADGAADLIVVILGTLHAYGIPFNEVWREVHRTNMAKKDGPVREDGKRLKPPGWEPPNIKQILLDAGAHPNTLE